MYLEGYLIKNSNTGFSEPEIQLMHRLPLGTIKLNNQETMKISKSIFIIGLILFFGCKTEKPKPQEKIETTSKIVSEFNLSQINKLDSIIKDYVIQNKSVGIEFGIQINNTEPIVKKYGYADIETKRKLKETDLFRIASITKTFTATAIMKLVETGKMSLNDTLNKFFPDYPNGKNITIYQLLSHTSGIPNWWEGGMPDNEPKNFPMCENPHQYLQGMKKPSIFEPGEFYSYSNTNYVLLGEIIKQISGETYEKFLEENIFSPSGMTQTEMEYLDKPSKYWINGYAYDESEENPFVEPQSYHMPFSAGGLRSNSIELLKFINTLNSGKIINQRTLEKMTEYALLKSGKPVYEGKYLPPNSKSSKPRANRTKFGYGLGFNLVELYGKPVYYHSGGISGFNSYLMHFPENNTTVSLLANVEDGIVPLLSEMRRIVNEIKPQE